MVNVGQQQQKAGEDPPYAGTSGNNRVVTRAPLLRSLASFFASFLRPFLRLLPALTTSGFFLGFLLVYSPPESTYPREQLTRNILVPLPSSLLFVLDSGEENYCFSRILLFYHFWNSSGVYGPLQWLPESFLSRYLRVSSFYGRRGIFRSIVFRNAYARLNVGYVGKRVETVGFRESG